MIDVLLIAGSPSLISRSTAALKLVRQELEKSGLATETIQVRQLPSDDLLTGRTHSPPIRRALDMVEQASGVIIAMSIHNFARSYALHALLQLLPAGSLEGKIVFPLATYSSPKHSPPSTWTLRPLLEMLGAKSIKPMLYLYENQIKMCDRRIFFDEDSRLSLLESTRHFTSELEQTLLPFWTPPQTRALMMVQ